VTLAGEDRRASVTPARQRVVRVTRVTDRRPGSTLCCGSGLTFATMTSLLALTPIAARVAFAGLIAGLYLTGHLTLPGALALGAAATVYVVTDGGRTCPLWLMVRHRLAVRRAQDSGAV
jgi:hypothetical protein